MQAELIVALDLPSADSVPKLVAALPPAVRYFKVGLELFTAEGPAILTRLRDLGKHVFLDLKLHDIPRTVARAVHAAAAHDAALLTVHAGGGRDMLSAAAEAARECKDRAPKLIAVTTLTSLNEDDLRSVGVNRSLADHTMALGTLAISAGIDGLVCSPLEAGAFRAALGTSPLLVTPGIRPSGADAGDQKRIATPAMAVQAGANFLVVGRPVVAAPDPAAAAAEILSQMETCARA